jgi:hypothetical protein
VRIDEFLRLLHGAKQVSATRWRARCPAHDGKSDSSLAVCAAEDGGVLLHCFGGCTPADVVGALGLKMGDLFAEKRDSTTATAAREKAGALGRYQKLSHEMHVLLQVVDARIASHTLEGDSKFRETRPDWRPYPSESWEREVKAASTIHSLLEKIYA